MTIFKVFLLFFLNTKTDLEKLPSIITVIKSRISTEIDALVHWL